MSIQSDIWEKKLGPVPLKCYWRPPFLHVRIRETFFLVAVYIDGKDVRWQGCPMAGMSNVRNVQLPVQSCIPYSAMHDTQCAVLYSEDNIESLLKQAFLT